MAEALATEGKVAVDYCPGLNDGGGVDDGESESESGGIGNLGRLLTVKLLVP